MRDNLGEVRIGTIKDLLELIIGFSMLISGWLLSFILVLDLIPKEYVFALSLLAYAISVMGLGLGMHGLTSWIALRVKKRRESSG